MFDKDSRASYLALDRFDVGVSPGAIPRKPSLASTSHPLSFSDVPDESASSAGYRRSEEAHSDGASVATLHTFTSSAEHSGDKTSRARSSTDSEGSLDEVKTKRLPPREFRWKDPWHNYYGFGWRRPLKHFGIFLGLVAVLCLFNFWFIRRSYKMYRISNHTYDIPLNDYPSVAIRPQRCGTQFGSLIGVDVPLVLLPFTSAKILDLAWNWTVGRGIQFLFVLLAGRVFADGLLKAAEAQKVPLPVFVSVAIFPARLDTIPSLTTGFAKSLGWRIKTTIIWLVISILFIAAFPSMMDLSTGYEFNMATVLDLPNNNSISLDSIMSLVSQYKTNISVPYCYYYASTGYHCDDREHSLVNLTKLRWNDTDLQRRWDEYFDPIFEATQKANRTNDTSYYPSSSDFWMGNQSVYGCKVNENGNTSYMWGFTFVWLTTSVAVSCAWLLGLWIFWVDADHNSQLARKRRTMGTYRAVVDIAEALREQLGPDLAAYSNDELAKAAAAADPVKYYVSDAFSPDPERGDELRDDGPGNATGRDAGGERTKSLPHVGLSSRSSRRVKLVWGQKYA